MKKTTSLLLVFLLLMVVFIVNAQNRRSNPIVSHMFTADATARVWEDERLYVYPSTDIAGTRSYSTMDGYHIFSTEDLITWKDHGEILHSRDVSWGWRKGGYMWAPDCVYKDGIYYYFFPHKNAKKIWEIGVATSRKPASDFEVQGYIKGGETFCDPNVFIDDDGEIYLYAVVDAKCYAAKLKDNMMEIEGEMVHQIGTDEHREGPFVFKRKGKYYMIYPDHHRPYNEMQYSMSDNPLGPWEPKGLIMEQNDLITMHGSMVEFKGQWYLFYHNGSLSGGISVNRSICFDPVYFNEDGTIQMIKKSLGVELPTFYKAINFNEMFGTLSVGNYQQKDLKKNGILPNGISSIQIPDGYVVECFEKDNFKGESWLFEEDRIDLNAVGCNNIISSLKITKSNTKNLVKNSSFELATQNQIKYWRGKSSEKLSWYRDTTAKGFYSLQYKGEGSPVEKVQQVQLSPKTNYELSVMLKIENGSTGQVIFDTNGTFDEVLKFELDANNRAGEWIEFNGVFNSGDSSTIDFSCTTSVDFNGACYWDNIVLREK
ncbi:family 43 glycosylhydrolase [Pseudalgibacter alginicilyticus]|nr:family 43 glycosylhydrolase [Pseudalgibacter alginicilyticus]